MKKTLTAAALVLVAAIAVAQPGMQSGQMGMGGMMMNMPKMPDLTADQWMKMDAAKTSYLRSVGPLKTDLAIKKLELGALWRADDIDSKKIMAKVSDINMVKAKLDAAKTDMMIAMFNALTPDQRKSVRMMMHGMMQRGMMPGMMMQGCPMMGGMMGGTSSGMMGMMGDDMMGSEASAMDPEQE